MQTFNKALRHCATKRLLIKAARLRQNWNPNDNYGYNIIHLILVRFLNLLLACIDTNCTFIHSWMKSIAVRERCRIADWRKGARLSNLVASTSLSLSLLTSIPRALITSLALPAIAPRSILESRENKRHSASPVLGSISYKCEKNEIVTVQKFASSLNMTENMICSSGNVTTECAVKAIK